MPIPPPLPPRWPYAPRPALPPLEVRETPLPGLEGVWTLESPALVLDAAVPGTLPFGRGGIRRVGELVLRPYRRGGLVRLVNAATYWGFRRFQDEFHVHRALWEAGFPTVEPLGWARRRRGLGWEGVFLTRFQEALPWPKAWERSAQVIPPLAELLKALCAWGLHAPDLNATNVLLAFDGQVLALDWDRARWAPGEDLLARYRDRLVRSLRKLGAPAALARDLDRALEP